MDLDALYEVMITDSMIQVWSPDFSGNDDGIIFEGNIRRSYKTVEPYMYNRVFQIEVDEQGKLYVGIEMK